MARRYSTAFDAAEALANLLAADGLGGATVLWGMPTQAEAAAEELVAVADVEPPTEQETAALGGSPAPRRREEYVIEVVVDVARQATAHADVNQRARDITHDVERVVDEHETLDGALHADGWCHIVTIAIEQLRAQETGAFRTIARPRVLCVARI